MRYPKCCAWGIFCAKLTSSALLDSKQFTAPYALWERVALCQKGEQHIKLMASSPKQWRSQKTLMHQKEKHGKPHTLSLIGAPMQKEIMIGARGMALKELGRQARKVSGEKAGFS